MITTNIGVADIHLAALILNISFGIFKIFLIFFLNFANNNHFVQYFCGEKWWAERRQGSRGSRPGGSGGALEGAQAGRRQARRQALGARPGGISPPPPVGSEK